MTKGTSQVARIRLPKGVGTLLILGGSFDPPHSGHIDAALSAVTRGRMTDAAVLLVPAAKSPHKPAGAFASDRHRVAMLRLVIGHLPGVRMWLDEVRRAASGEPSYTIDTLRRLRSVVPECVRLRLVIGTDQAAVFHTWRAPREIIEIAEPIVLRRRPVTTAAGLVKAIDHGFWTPSERDAWGKRLAKNTLRADNSTAIRAAILKAPSDVARWKAYPGLRDLHPAVARYIAAHGLYGFAGSRRMMIQRKRPSA